MATIYVIEMIIEDDVVTSHIFLTCSKAYDKIGELLRDNYSATQLQLIKKQINDETGLSEDELVYKTDDLNILEEKDKD
jgi:hypothetical protein